MASTSTSPTGVRTVPAPSLHREQGKSRLVPYPCQCRLDEDAADILFGALARLGGWLGYETCYPQESGVR